MQLYNVHYSQIMAGRPLCSTVPGLFRPSDRTCVGPTQPRQRSETRHGMCWWKSTRDVMFSLILLLNGMIALYNPESGLNYEWIILNSTLAHMKSQSPTILPVIFVIPGKWSQSAGCFVDANDAWRMLYDINEKIYKEKEIKSTKCGMNWNQRYLTHSKGIKPMGNPRPLLKLGKTVISCHIAYPPTCVCSREAGIMTANVSCNICFDIFLPRWSHDQVFFKEMRFGSPYDILNLLIASPQCLFHRCAGGFCTMAMKWFLAAFLVRCLSFTRYTDEATSFIVTPIHPTWGLGGRCGKPCWGAQDGLMGHSSTSFSDQWTGCGCVMLLDRQVWCVMYQESDWCFPGCFLTMWKTWPVDCLVVAKFCGKIWVALTKVGKVVTLLESMEGEIVEEGKAFERGFIQMNSMTSQSGLGVGGFWWIGWPGWVG